LLLVEGLPFGSPPKPERVSLIPFIVFGPVVAGIGFLLQWLFIFQSRTVTAGATLAFAVAAILTARATLARLEVNVIHNLARLSAGPMRMFASAGE
jgi:hypothetical protein